MCGGRWGWHGVLGFGSFWGLLGACSGVVVGVVSWVGLGCSVCVSCMICGLLLVGCWGLLVLGGLL